VKAERVIFDFQADGEGEAGGNVLLDGFLGEVAAAARVDVGTLPLGCEDALGLKFLRSAEAAVGLSFGEKARSVLSVDGEAFGLAVGTVDAQIGYAKGRQARAFVPIDAEPVEIFNELVFKASLRALEVGVLNAEDELAAGVAGEKPIVERRARVTHVELAGGGRREPDTGKSVVHGSHDDRR